MNKKELIEALALKNSVSQEKSKEFLNSLIDIVIEQTLNGEKVKIKDFGNFEKKVRKERNGVKPKTGEKIIIPESSTLKFIPAKFVKEEFNK